MLKVLRWIVAALAGGIVLAAALSWLGFLHWTLELLTHFRFYYFLLGAALALAAFALRLHRMAAAAALMAAISGAAVWPHMVLPKTIIYPVPAVRILWVNLHNWATDIEALGQLIEREKPDIAVFTELAGTHEPVLRAMRRLLPFQTPVPSGGNPLDLMLLSKLPPESLHFDLAMGDKAPLLVAKLCPAPPLCLTLIGLHASRPFPRDGGARDRQLDHAAATARRHIDAGERVMLLGDLNVTPFSPVFDRLLARGGLSDTASMMAEYPRAPTSTWWLANTGIGLPIDHALVGPNIIVAARRLGRPIGSDHLPLIVDIRIVP